MYKVTSGQISAAFPSSNYPAPLENRTQTRPKNQKTSGHQPFKIAQLERTATAMLQKPQPFFRKFSSQSKTGATWMTAQSAQRQLRYLDLLLCLLLKVTLFFSFFFSFFVFSALLLFLMLFFCFAIRPELVAVSVLY